ncbi:LuxR C-terminal-related transcriptional regulator, partial [Pseudomonas aeruginosa]|uniref:LuxR C-terminal-related transcriptional regulator n=1 Tax=Pseudomonas aeruginosa TaxID=287 RepID=UPI0010ADCFFB
LPKDSQDYENAFIVGNYPAAWREHYDRAGYARVDPTVSHCTQSVLPTLWMLKDYALQSGAGLAFEHPVSKPVVLTSREKEVLQWCAIGKTSWEISVICNCSEANVNFHMGNIRRKFGVTSRRVAAIMAVNLGLITL